MSWKGKCVMLYLVIILYISFLSPFLPAERVTIECSGLFFSSVWAGLPSSLLGRTVLNVSFSLFMTACRQDLYICDTLPLRFVFPSPPLFPSSSFHFSFLTIENIVGASRIWICFSSGAILGCFFWSRLCCCWLWFRFCLTSVVRFWGYGCYLCRCMGSVDV